MPKNEYHKFITSGFIRKCCLGQMLMACDPYNESTDLSANKSFLICNVAISDYQCLGYYMASSTESQLKSTQLGWFAP